MNNIFSNAKLLEDIEQTQEVFAGILDRYFGEGTLKTLRPKVRRSKNMHIYRLHWWDKEEFDNLILAKSRPGSNFKDVPGPWIHVTDLEEILNLTLKPFEEEQLEKILNQTGRDKVEKIEKESEENLSDYYRRQIKGTAIETWDITQAWDLGRCEAQALQYILRAKYKGQEKEDLQKAIRFLQRAVEEIEEMEEDLTLLF